MAGVLKLGIFFGCTSFLLPLGSLLLLEAFLVGPRVDRFAIGSLIDVDYWPFAPRRLLSIIPTHLLGHLERLGRQELEVFLASAILILLF